MAVNDSINQPNQYPESLFGVSLPQGTGAAGSPGATEASALPDAGGVTVPVSIYQASSQAPVPVVSVARDDVNPPAQSAAYRLPDPLTGVSGLDATGAGLGSAGHQAHPNSPWNRAGA